MGESRLSPPIRYDGHPAGSGNGERYWQVKATRLASIGHGTSAVLLLLFGTGERPDSEKE